MFDVWLFWFKMVSAAFAVFYAIGIGVLFHDLGFGIDLVGISAFMLLVLTLSAVPVALLLTIMLGRPTAPEE